jgi:proteasome lid subunit RPN8/RPN11
MRISRAHWDDLVAHAQEEAPNECCGYARLRDGTVEEVFRGHNERQSPYGFVMDGRSLLAANELDDEGFEVAVYHSHPRSAPVPSEQDRNVAMYPHWLNLIVSLDGEPQVRAWWIRDRDVEEEPVEIG